MKHVTRHLAVAAGLLVAAAVANPAIAAGVFTLTSPAFKDNGVMARKFAGNNKARSPNCVGDNISPPLAWHNPPPGTKSFVLLLHDPDIRPPEGIEHMVIYGIPASVTHFAEGALSAPSPEFVGGRSTMDLGIYFGPCVPPGVDWHHFTWTIVATDLDAKALPPGLTRAELIPAMKGHVKGSAGLIMRWRHPR
jgi:Raf kinase inhibitor-like YbhB/YbcL family protein